MYEPDRVSTFTRSPMVTNSGTWIVAPVSSVAGLFAPPLPGLTCWNSRILKTVPSTSMWFPFLNWLVLIATMRLAPRSPPGESHCDAAEDDGRYVRVSRRLGREGPGYISPRVQREAIE